MTRTTEAIEELSAHHMRRVTVLESELRDARALAGHLMDTLARLTVGPAAINPAYAPHLLPDWMTGEDNGRLFWNRGAE